MWTKHELEDLSETFRDIKLEDIVDEDELAVIKENSTRYFNLKNGLVVPKHKNKVFVILLSDYDDFLRQKPFCSSRSMEQFTWIAGSRLLVKPYDGVL